MKYSIILTLTVTLYLFNSCIRDDETLTYFDIYNNDTTNITLNIYNVDIPSYHPPIDSSIILSPGDFFRYSVTGKGEDAPSMFPLGSHTDSIEYIINGRIIATHINPFKFESNTPNNVFLLENYSENKKSDGWYIYSYQITKAVVPQ